MKRTAVLGLTAFLLTSASVALGGWEERVGSKFNTSIFNGVTTSDTGRWVDTRDYKSAVLITDMLGGGDAFSATLYVTFSCSTTGKPSDATHGQVVGSAITASGLTSLTYLGSWMKIRITANSGATTYLSAVIRK
jgi:hypothetical protein